MSLKLKILIPAAVVILLIAVVANRRDGGLPTTSPLGSASSSATTDEIINAMINDSISEQSILDEANGDTQYVNYDSAQVEAFTSVYNANEY